MIFFKRFFFIRIAKKIGLLDKINLKLNRKWNNRYIHIPLIRGLGYGTFIDADTWIISLLKYIYPIHKGAFLDIGVNTGQTMIKVKSFDPDLSFIGLEPNPACCFYLNELIRSNRFKKTTIIPTAMFNSNGFIPLNLYSYNQDDSSASIIDNFRPASKPLSTRLVPVCRWKEIVRVIGDSNIGTIKIDVEGAELEILLELEDYILNHRPFVITEILPVYEPKNTFRLNRQRRIEKIFKGLDYVLYRVKQDSKGTLVGLENILEIGIHSDITKCDYISVPREKIQFLLDGVFGSYQKEKF